MLRPIFSILVLASLAACGKPAGRVEDVRPVRVAEIRAAAVEATEVFSGEIRARVESALGFRVGGKIIAREVDVGTPVRPGQVLARLDPGDLRLDAAGARAQLKAARSQLDLARSDVKRQRILMERGHISQALYDRYDSQYTVAAARVDALAQQARERDNQAAYATLVADRAGVVTAVEAEPGQVVQPGRPVIRLAQAGEPEVAIAVPETRIALFHPGGTVTVTAWAEPGRPMPGIVREVAAAADPATRTFRVRVAIPDAPDGLRLGMTANVALRHAQAAPGLSLPLSALIARGEDRAVWVLDPATNTVARRKVVLAGLDREAVLVGQGLSPGELVVVAGANLLRQGQRVCVQAPDDRIAQVAQ